MNNIILKHINYVYFFSILVILIFYLFPGDIVNYFIYGELKHNVGVKHDIVGSSVHWVINTGGYSINHTIIFFYITFTGLYFFFKNNFSIGILTFIFFSIILEILHLIIPNRSFEFIHLISNLVGVILALILFRKFKK